MDAYKQIHIYNIQINRRNMYKSIRTLYNYIQKVYLSKGLYYMRMQNINILVNTVCKFLARKLIS